MRPFDPILYPFSFLYDTVTALRNRMFDLGLKKSINFEVPTVVVGNLALGGTGKTPMVEFLIRSFKEQYHIATLSRGYGRKTTGFLMANEGLHAHDIGDEPFQIYQKFGKEVTVAVGEERILAIPYILAERPETDLLLLDDAFQHRYVEGDINILLTTYQKPFFEDKILPMGTLREHPKGARRADVVIVTKCPEDLDAEVRERYRSKIRQYSKEGCLILFSGLKYGEPYSVNHSSDQLGAEVILLSGIANNEVLQAEVKRKYNLLDTVEFPDHHKYTDRDLKEVFTLWEKHKSRKPAILTTEKDAVKLKDDKFLNYLREIPIFALPVEVSLHPKEEEVFLSLLAKTICEKKDKSEI